MFQSKQKIKEKNKIILEKDPNNLNKTANS